ncbi:MAG: hypothetical protein WC375_12885 [Methanomassiliicoccales archaeon]|jgi:hypothetical protein
MDGLGVYKGTLLVSIQPDKKDVRRYRIIRSVYPIMTAAVILGVLLVMFILFGTDIPMDILFVILLMVPMGIFTDIFTLAIVTPIAFPIDVYSNGIEFRTTRLGAKMNLAGFIERNGIDRIELVLPQSTRLNRGVYIWLKNNRLQLIHRKSDEDLIRIARTIGDSLKFTVQQK